MASIDTRPDGHFARVRWREGGAQRAKHFAANEKRQARTFAATVEADQARGVFIPPDAGSITLDDYMTRFREVQAHRASTALNYEVICRVHITPGLGRYRLGEIRQSHIKAWMRERSTAMAPSSLKVAFKILRAILRSAVADRLIHLDPSEGVKAPSVPRRKADPLTLEQLGALARWFPPGTGAW